MSGDRKWWERLREESLVWDVRNYSQAARAYLDISAHNTDPSVDQGTFCWGDPGPVASNTLDTPAADRTANKDGTGNYQAFLRIELVQTITNHDQNRTRTYKLQAQKNGTGGYSDVTATETIGVRVVDNASNTDGAALSNDRISGSGNTFQAGEYDEGNGVLDSITWIAGVSHTEVCWSLEFVDASLAENDFLDFRVIESGGALLANTGTADLPRLTWTSASSPVSQTKTVSSENNASVTRTLTVAACALAIAAATLSVPSEHASLVTATSTVPAENEARPGMAAVEFTATIAASSDTSGAVTLSTPVPVGKSFPVFSLRGGPGDNPRQTAVEPVLGNIVNGKYTEITFNLTGGGTTVLVTIEGFVVYGEDVTVTTYTGDMLATDGDTKNVTISTIDTTKDFLVLYAGGGSNAFSRATMRGHFSTTTNLQLYRGNVSGDMHYTAYVVRIEGATVQASLVTIETAVNSGLYADMSLSAITLAQSFFIYNWTNEATSQNPGRYYTEGRFTSTTNLRLRRDIDGGASWEGRYSVYVVSHPKLVVEQTDSVQAVGTTTTSDNLAGTFADDGSRWIVPGNFQGNASHNTSVATELDQGLMTHVFNSTTQIGMERSDGTNTVTVTSQAVRWSGVAPTPVSRTITQTSESMERAFKAFIVPTEHKSLISQTVVQTSEHFSATTQTAAQESEHLSAVATTVAQISENQERAFKAFIVPAEHDNEPLPLTQTISVPSEHAGTSSQTLTQESEHLSLAAATLPVEAENQEATSSTLTVVSEDLALVTPAIAVPAENQQSITDTVTVPAEHQGVPTFPVDRTLLVQSESLFLTVIPAVVHSEHKQETGTTPVSQTISVLSESLAVAASTLDADAEHFEATSSTITVLAEQDGSISRTIVAPSEHYSSLSVAVVVDSEHLSAVATTIAADAENVEGLSTALAVLAEHQSVVTGGRSVPAEHDGQPPSASTGRYISNRSRFLTMRRGP